MASKQTAETEIPVSTATDLEPFKGEGGDPAGWCAERIIRLEPGQSIEGLYLGPGSELELSEQYNKVTGEVTRVPTWRVGSTRSAAVVAVVVGKYELNRFFSDKTPGNTLIKVKCTGTLKRGARQVTCYETAYKVDPARTATGPSVTELERTARVK